MGEVGELRPWDELIPDALGLIFCNLSLQEKLTVIPRVCKAWGRAVSSPHCWQEIDIEEWSLWRKPEQVDRMIEMLVRRSCGVLRRLSVSGLANEAILNLIADHAGSLQTLELPRCELSNSVIEQVAARLSTVTFLDFSCCQNLGAPALEVIGKNCKSLVGLRRAMHPLEMVDKGDQDDEASAIAATMPKLRHLEVAYSLLTTGGVLEILSGCRDLEFLDVRGCWEVELPPEFMKEKHGGLKVLGPEVDDSYETSFWVDGCSDYSDSLVYSWEFMEDGGGWEEQQVLEGLEVTFYGGGFGDDIADFGWPSSP